MIRNSIAGILHGCYSCGGCCEREPRRVNARWSGIASFRTIQRACKLEGSKNVIRSAWNIANLDGHSASNAQAGVAEVEERWLSQQQGSWQLATSLAIRSVFDSFSSRYIQIVIGDFDTESKMQALYVSGLIRVDEVYYSLSTTLSRPVPCLFFRSSTVFQALRRQSLTPTPLIQLPATLKVPSKPCCRPLCILLSLLS